MLVATPLLLSDTDSSLLKTHAASTESGNPSPGPHICRDIIEKTSCKYVQEAVAADMVITADLCRAVGTPPGQGSKAPWTSRRSLMSSAARSLQSSLIK